MFEIAVEPAMRGDARDRSGEENQHLAERAEAVGDDQAAEQGTGILWATERKDSRNDQDRDSGPSGERGSVAAAESSDHHQHDRTDCQDDFGEDGGDIHQWASAGVE